MAVFDAVGLRTQVGVLTQPTRASQRTESRQSAGDAMGHELPLSIGGERYIHCRVVENETIEMLADLLWPALLPKKYFISHAYADANLGLVDRCIRNLPMNIRPFIFPAITVPPEQRVSDDLVEALLRCDGLIYIIGENTSKSLWVNFEKDFALRNGRPVFRFDPTSCAFLRDRSLPVTPNIVTWVWGDPERAEVLLKDVNDHLSMRRFTVNQSGSSRVPKDERVFEDFLNNNIVHLSFGAQLLIFACNGAPYTDYDLMFFGAKFSGFKSQTIIAALEPLQEGDGSLLRWSKNAASVGLYGSPGGPQIDWRRVDDLVVRLFSMMYATTNRAKLETS